MNDLASVAALAPVALGKIYKIVFKIEVFIGEIDKKKEIPLKVYLAASGATGATVLKSLMLRLHQCFAFLLPLCATGFTVV
jgi:hypothetical protein